MRRHSSLGRVLLLSVIVLALMTMLPAIIPAMVVGWLLTRGANSPKHRTGSSLPAGGSVADQSMNDLELLKLRLDYAWKWFDLHAKQRMTLFNYFLIIAGIFANAIVISFKDANMLANQPVVATTSAQPSTVTAVMPPGTQPASMPTMQASAAASTPGTGTPLLAVQKLNFMRRSIGVLGALASLAFIVFDVISRRLNSRAEDILEQLEHAVLFPDPFRFTADGSNKQLGLLRHENPQRIRDSGSLWARATRMKLWIRGIEAMVGVFFLYSALI